MEVGGLLLLEYRWDELEVCIVLPHTLSVKSHCSSEVTTSIVSYACILLYSVMSTQKIQRALNHQDEQGAHRARWSMIRERKRGKKS